MFSGKTWGLALPLAALAAAAASAAPASASILQTQQLGCESSVLQVTSLLSPVLGPVTSGVANPGIDPCSTVAPVTSVAGTVLNLGSLGSVTGLLGGAPDLTGAASAVTSSTVTAGTTSALATATENGVTVPTPAGDVTIPPATTSVGYACQDGSVVPKVTSTLPSITIAGQTYTLPTTGGTETIPLGLLGSLGSVTVDPDNVTSTSATTALADIDVAGVADIDVGSAMVTQPASNVCSLLTLPGGSGNGGNGGNGSGGGNGGNGSGGGTGGQGGAGGPGGSASTACPAGTFQDNSACVLSVGTGTGPITIVPANSSDIQGGTVISLATARKRYHSACLKGSGPKYVIVGTNKANRITVSKIRARVLALGGNDTVTVKGGARTCVDGGAGKDTITNMRTNRVSLYGGKGNDRIRVGNGPAFISGGDGNDTVIAGTGRDTIGVGSGHNVITARGTHDRVSAMGGRTIAHLPRADMAYARKHGIKRLIALRG